MTDERLIELLGGPLASPRPIVRLTRLMMAIRLVVAAGGRPAEIALKEYAAQCAVMESAGNEGVK